MLAEVDSSTFEFAIATPDQDVYIEVLDGSNGSNVDLQHFYLGGPGGGLPRGVPANSIYGFALSANEYSRLMREGAAVALAERTARGIVGVPPGLGVHAGGAPPPAGGAAVVAPVRAVAAPAEVWVLGECCGDCKIGEQVVPPAGLPSLGKYGLMSMVDRDGAPSSGSDQKDAG